MSRAGFLFGLMFWTVSCLQNRGFANSKDLHWIDLAYLLPIDFNHIEEGFPRTKNLLNDKSLRQMFGHLYAPENFESAYPILKRTQIQQQGLELADRSCSIDPQNWRLVAVRLEPYASVIKGSGAFLAQRAKKHPKLNDSQIPQLRLTYQLFCNGQQWAFDSAIHLLYTAYSTSDQVDRFHTFWKGYQRALTKSSKEKIKKTEMKLLNFINAPSQMADQLKMIDFIRSQGKLRVAAGLSTTGVDYQESFCITGKRGFPCMDSAGQLTSPLVHPAFLHLGEAPTKRKLRRNLANFITRYANPANVYQIRTLNAGDGQLFWNFRNFEPTRVQKQPHLEHRDIDLWTTKSNQPVKVASIGKLDFLPITAYPGITHSALRYLQSKLSISNVQASANSAKEAVKKGSIEDNPSLRHASESSCHHCHASHEKTTMALRHANGELPMEFGYLFRAFGYIGDTPFLSRRFINEVKHSILRIGRESQN